MMSHTGFTLFSRICSISGRRATATLALNEVQEAKVVSKQELEAVYTSECNPGKHNTEHLNRVYQVPNDITKVLGDGLPRETSKRIQILREFGVLIRKPALELISYMKQADYTKPINKYVLYGRDGVGKTTTMIHLIHYGIANDFIVLHLPWVCTWYRFPIKVVQSPLNPDLLDLPDDAANWLKYFKALNHSKLEKCDLKVSKEHTWSSRESTYSGAPISELIEFGLQKTQFACGVIAALIDELKAVSTAGKCKTMIVIDGFNALLSDVTLIKDDKHVYVSPERVSITAPFFNSVDYNWCNGAAIVSVDIKATKDRRKSEFPTYLLGKKGFEQLDPFIPVCVENYSLDEFHTILNYYDKRKWVRDLSPQGKKELELLTNKNPLDLWNYCKPL